MSGLFLLICFSELTAHLKPPNKWWGHITYLFTWPEHLASYIKENVENGKR